MLISRHREKLLNALVFFAENTRKFGKTKAIKLLFLLDFEHFRQTGRTVTGLRYQAWEKGPVPVTVYEEVDFPHPDFQAHIGVTPKKIENGWIFCEITAKLPFDGSFFSPRELRIMRSLTQRFHGHNSQQMIDVSHEAFDGAWKKIFNPESTGTEIPFDLALAKEPADIQDAIRERAAEHDAILAMFR